jgi:hypothetical protein
MVEKAIDRSVDQISVDFRRSGELARDKGTYRMAL